MELSKRQEEIKEIVREYGPITGKTIAARLHVTRAALRSDLAVLTMMGILDARPKVGYYYVGGTQINPLADRIKQITVEQAAASPVVVPSTTSLYNTIVMMFTEDVGTLLVCDEGYLQGIVSRKDLLRAALGQSDPHTIPISMIMTPSSKVICISPTDNVVEAAQKMIEYEVDCLPVVVREEEVGKKRLKVVGRISKTTITKLFYECGTPK